MGRGSSGTGGTTRSGDGIPESETRGGKVYKTRSNGVATLGNNTTNADVMATIKNGEFKQRPAVVGDGEYDLGIKVKDGTNYEVNLQVSASPPGYANNPTGKWAVLESPSYNKDGEFKFNDIKTFNSKESCMEGARKTLADKYRKSFMYKRKASK